MSEECREKLYLFFFFFFIVISFLLLDIFGGILIIKRKTIYSMKTPKYYIREWVCECFYSLLQCCMLIVLYVFDSCFIALGVANALLFAFSLSEKIREFGCKKQHRVRYFVFLYQFSCSYPTISCY